MTWQSAGRDGRLPSSGPLGSRRSRPTRQRPLLYRTRPATSRPWNPPIAARTSATSPRALPGVAREDTLRLWTTSSAPGSPTWWCATRRTSVRGSLPSVTTCRAPWRWCWLQDPCFVESSWQARWQISEARTACHQTRPCACSTVTWCSARSRPASDTPTIRCLPTRSRFAPPHPAGHSTPGHLLSHRLLHLGHLLQQPIGRPHRAGVRRHARLPGTRHRTGNRPGPRRH